MNKNDKISAVVEFNSCSGRQKKQKSDQTVSLVLDGCVILRINIGRHDGYGEAG